MVTKIRSITFSPNILETVNYLECEVRGEIFERKRKTKEIEELYFNSTESHRNNLLRLVKAMGDQPAIRQIIFFHYLINEPMMAEMFLRYIYPGFQNKRYVFKEKELKFFMAQLGLNQEEQSGTLKFFYKALIEAKMLKSQGNIKYLEYQRPSVEAIAYAFYAEYADGFAAANRFALKNPPLKQITEQAAFSAYLLLEPRLVPMMLEACRIKNYISLEARGGLHQYALIYQDLTGLVDFIVGGGCRG
ncbi:MAG: hypothetical protein KAX49_13665 [Halanaerobiales bacterium]|nr:hypothetical protein [Halanaerobiales bacterium]